MHLMHLFVAAIPTFGQGKERKYPMARDMTPRQVAEAYLAAERPRRRRRGCIMADDVTYLDVIVGEQKGRDAARDKVIKLSVTAVPDLTGR